MVGDAPQWDIKGAKAVGMKTCLARYGLMDYANAKKIRADYEIEDISKLLRIVK
jgi:FMN phosphatase YigB (HAD superfamily)